MTDARFTQINADEWELLTIDVAYIEKGDTFWQQHEGFGSPIPLNTFEWKVIGGPRMTENRQLFAGECWIIVVEYADGSRGSRIYDKKAKIAINRKKS